MADTAQITNHAAPIRPTPNLPRPLIALRPLVMSLILCTPALVTPLMADASGKYHVQNVKAEAARNATPRSTSPLYICPAPGTNNDNDTATPDLRSIQRSLSPNSNTTDC